MLASTTTKHPVPICRPLVGLGLLLLCGFFAAPIRSQQVAGIQNELIATSTPSAANDPAAQRPDPQTFGMIKGKVVDQSGTFITGAIVRLTRGGQTLSPDVMSDEEGQYLFVNIPPGPFEVTISCEGLASQTVSGTLHPAESYVVPLLTLVVATQVTEVRVALDPVELAQVQIKEQEQQRVFGVIPNFYVSYFPDAAPLSPKQKFHLAWKSASDPVTLVAVGMLAGFDQAADRWGAYGQGFQGYVKRYGASYADIFSATFLAGAVLPSVLKQDPRYFYKGTGTKRSRILYAIRSTVICKGDNGNWQPNYSAVIGDLAGAGLSNLYYPPHDRNDVGAIFANAVVRLGEIALSNILQELIIPRFTPNLSNRAVRP